MLRLLLGMMVVAGLVQAAEIENPSFELAETGWKLHARMPKESTSKPTLATDEAEFKAGKRSLEVTVEDAGDVSVRQRIFLPVGSLWRAKAWLRAQNLKGTAEPGGQLAIYTPNGFVGMSAGKLPEATWREETVTFRVPSPGAVDITLLATRRATGKVWFDDVRLEPLTAPGVKEVRILPTRLGKRPIDVKQGGQFIEPLCNLIPSITAQQVDLPSFEEEPKWNVSYKAATDKPYRPWYPEGAVHVTTYSFDTESPYNGKRSQKIELPLARARAGISQDGFYTRAGITYKLRLHMKSSGNVPVWASLRSGSEAIAKPILLGRAGRDWGAAETKLVATRASENATLTILFEGPGTLWLDQVYLIGEDAVLGIWRADMVEGLRAMNPGVVRWGGSTIEAFEWEKSIGPWDTRAPFANIPFWGGLEPNFASIEEFVQLCQHIKAEPLICVRWTGKTPADAAAQVEYFNGGPETLWGKVRAKNGRVKPYGVKLWQIGNEVGGGVYDDSVRAFAEAMRKVDPAIKVLSSYPSADTLARGEGYLDYLCPHHYECGDLEGKEKNLKFLQEVIERHGKGRDIRVAVTEWNTTAGEWGLGRGMLQTLGNALGCARYHNLMQRYADLIEIAIRSNLADSFGSGVLVPGPGWMYYAPTFHAQKMYARAAGSYTVKVEAASDLPWHLQEPDISATLTGDGKILRIYAVNSTPEALPVSFDLSGFEREFHSGRQISLVDWEKALDSEVMNTRDDPGRVAPKEQPLAVRGKKFKHSFAPLSVNLLELTM